MTSPSKYYEVKACKRSARYNEDDYTEIVFMVCDSTGHLTSADVNRRLEAFNQAAAEKLGFELGKMIGVLHYEEIESPVIITSHTTERNLRSVSGDVRRDPCG